MPWVFASPLLFSCTTSFWHLLPGWHWRPSTCTWPSWRCSTPTSPALWWRLDLLAGVRDWSVTFMLSAQVLKAALFKLFCMSEGVWPYNSFFFKGIPLVVVIIVIAINKDNYGLVTYGRYADGVTNDLWVTIPIFLSTKLTYIYIYSV